mmetsp:Transcript_39076/g.47621  ORF Transcript_39076/g.47621 Transcript_39076/m.47621 type:complete len:241 (+) Transcript_39076:1400-2122(+)
MDAAISLYRRCMSSRTVWTRFKSFAMPFRIDANASLLAPSSKSFSATRISSRATLKPVATSYPCFKLENKMRRLYPSVILWTLPHKFFPFSFPSQSMEGSLTVTICECRIFFARRATRRRRTRRIKRNVRSILSDPDNLPRMSPAPSSTMSKSTTMVSVIMYGSTAYSCQSSMQKRRIHSSTKNTVVIVMSNTKYRSDSMSTVNDRIVDAMARTKIAEMTGTLSRTLRIFCRLVLFKASL